MKGVGQLIDELPVGRFHAMHLARQILFNAVLAITIECTPFIFQGLALEFGGSLGGMSTTQETLYALTFLLGGAVGAGIGAMQDVFGRKVVIQWSAFLAVAINATAYACKNLTSIYMERFFFGIAFFSMQFSLSAWYTELLPIRGRGMLYTALTAGYPLGRLAAIKIAELLGPRRWRVWTAVRSGSIAGIWLLSLLIVGSPRHLAALGKETQARDMMRKIYAFNRTPFPEEGEDEGGAAEDGAGEEAGEAKEDRRAPPSAADPSRAEARLRKPFPKTEATPLIDAKGDDAATDAAASGSARSFIEAAVLLPAKVATAIWGRWSELLRSPPNHLLYAIGLFVGLAIQQVLITNYGPRVTQVLIYPDSQTSTGLAPKGKMDDLPYEILLIFNYCDWAGILLSSLIIDVLGRRGFLLMGFVVSAVLWLSMGVIKPAGNVPVNQTTPGLSVALIVVGCFAHATRGYAPEAVNLWVLETVPTNQRGASYAACNVVFMLTQSVVLPIGGAIVGAVNFAPTPLLCGYAVIQLIVGIYCIYLPTETANKALSE